MSQPASEVRQSTGSEGRDPAVDGVPPGAGDHGRARRSPVMPARWRDRSSPASTPVVIGAVALALVTLAIGVLVIMVGDDDGADLAGVRPSIVALVEADVDEATAVETLPDLVAAVERRPEVRRAAGEGREGGYVIYATPESSTRSTGGAGPAVTEAVADHLADASPTVTLGGRAPFLQAVAGAYWRSVLGLVMVGLIGAAYMGWRFGLRPGIAAAISSIVAIPLAGALPSRMLADFDGTLTTTSLPGALIGTVVVVTASLRLARWFERRSLRVGPSGVDEQGADLVVASIRENAPAFLLAAAALSVTAVVVDWLSPRHSALLPLAIGSLTAIALVHAITPFIMAADTAEPEPVPATPIVRVGPDALSTTIAGIDGRNFSLGLLALFGAVLLALSGFALRDPRGGVITPADLDSGSRVGMADAFLREQGADPTRSVAVALNQDSADQATATWAAALSDDPMVAWVDVAGSRFVAGSAMESSPVNSLVGPTLFEPADPDRADRVAVVVPSDAGMADPARFVDLATTADGAVVPGVIDADAAPVDSGPVADRGALLAAIVLLALLAGLAARLLTGDLGTAAVAGGLQLLEGAATVGLFNLLIPTVTAAEILTGAGVVSFALMLVSVEVIEELIVEPRRRWWPRAHALDATAGPVALALGGVMLVVASALGGGPLTTRFGVCLAVSSAVTLIVGVLVLRPALLVQRAQYQTLARPFRLYALSGTGAGGAHGRSVRTDRSTPSADADVNSDDYTGHDHTGHDHIGPGHIGDGEIERWRRVAGGLIETEFVANCRPGDELLSTLFVEDTPIHRQAVERREALLSAGLRVVGSSPKLVSVTPVLDHFTAKLDVVTEHPRCDLVDTGGRVVGRRGAERKRGTLWVVEGPDRRWRVLESIERSSDPMPSMPPLPDIDLRADQSAEQRSFAPTPN